MTGLRMRAALFGMTALFGLAALGLGGTLAVRDARGAGGEACRDPRIYGRGFSEIQPCRPKRWYRKAEELMAAMGRGEQLDDDPRLFLCFEDEPEVKEALDKAAGYCRDLEQRMARLAGEPAAAVDDVAGLVGGLAWTVMADAQAMAELWGQHGLLRAMLDDAAWASFQTARRDSEGALNRVWSGLVEAGVDQLPALGRSSVVIEPAKVPGETWHWRWEAPMRFTRVLPSAGQVKGDIHQLGPSVQAPSTFPGAGEPPLRTVQEMQTVVVVRMRGRFDPVWAGDGNPLGVVAESYEETVEPATK